MNRAFIIELGFKRSHVHFDLVEQESGAFRGDEPKTVHESETTLQDCVIEFDRLTQKGDTLRFGGFAGGMCLVKM